MITDQKFPAISHSQIQRWSALERNRNTIGLQLPISIPHQAPDASNIRRCSPELHLVIRAVGRIRNTIAKPGEARSNYSSRRTIIER